MNDREYWKSKVVDVRPGKIRYSIVFTRATFDLGFKKKFSAKACYSTLVPRLSYFKYCATSKDHWVPRTLFVLLTN